jgi:hypothetical protein
MTNEQIQKRKKIAKTIAISLILTAVISPFIITKERDARIFLLIFFVLFALVLSGGAVMAIVPEIPEQNKK